MKSYDEELVQFADAMEEPITAFRSESQLPLDGRRFDDLTETEFLTLTHSNVTRLVQEVYSGRADAAATAGMQILFNIARRKRNLGPDATDEDRYDLGGLEKLRDRPGPVE